MSDVFEKRAKQLLDERANGLDGTTSSMLHQARNRALESVGQSSFNWSNWGVSVAVAASLMASAVYLYTPLDTIENLGVVVFDNVQEEAIAADMELMDDLDFIAWLVLQEKENDELATNS